MHVATSFLCYNSFPLKMSQCNLEGMSYSHNFCSFFYKLHIFLMGERTSTSKLKYKGLGFCCYFVIFPLINNLLNKT